MIGMIAAVSPEGVIGVNGHIPWHYAADSKRFKRLTTGCTVIMGRHTWESLGGRPLPKRRNIVITRRRLANVECFTELHTALESCEGDVWLIGGAGIYAEGMRFAHCIDLTYVPDRIDAPNAVHFPAIDTKRWHAGPKAPLPDEPHLSQQRFTRL